jgi:nucleotide-binding universal stress UspA family protein
VSADIPTGGQPGPAAEIRRVIVATDFTEASAGAVCLASTIADAFQAELLILHVLQEGDESSRAPAALGTAPGDLLERRASEAESRLGRLRALAGAGHIHGTIRCGSAATQILRFAKDAGADLIVLGSHGRCASRDGAAAPMAERVRTRAQCPVIVVAPPPGRAAMTAASGRPGPASS